SFGTVAYQSALRKTYSPTGSRRSRPPADQGWYRRRLQRESAGGNVRKSPNSKKSSIKALTIRQPFPELILRKRKHVEIRSWRTHYRGPLLIHAGMRMDSEFARELGLNPEKLTTSAFVGVAVLSDVRPYTRADSKLLKKR